MSTVQDQLFQFGGMPVLPGGVPLGNLRGNYFFVDGTRGADGNSGRTLKRAFATIQRAFTVNAGRPNACVFVLPKEMAVTSTDPVSYAETVIIDAPSSALIGVSRGVTQGGLPQIRKGSGAVAHITVRAPGCLISGIGINGASATGGGILLDDDGGATKSAFGTTIFGCHFKNCKGSTATNAATGGAIQWATAGNAWQVRIQGNRFYKNVGDVVLIGTGGSVPQDVVIDSNQFSGPAASVDCNLYLAGGSGMNGVHITNNVFPALPAIGAGSQVAYIKATGCIGILAGNRFGTDSAFGGAQVNTIPTTLFLAGNWDEGGLIARV